MAKAKTRIYLIKDRKGNISLVRAYSSTQARSHIAEQMFSVEVAGQEALVKYLSLGSEVEDASKPETADAFDPANVGPDKAPEDRSTHVTEVA